MITNATVDHGKTPGRTRFTGPSLSLCVIFGIDTRVRLYSLYVRSARDDRCDYVTYRTVRTRPNRAPPLSKSVRAFFVHYRVRRVWIAEQNTVNRSSRGYVTGLDTSISSFAFSPFSFILRPLRNVSRIERSAHLPHARMPSN